MSEQRQSNRSRHVVAPALFPKGIRYSIVGSSETARLLGRLLAKLQPKSEALSWQDELPHDDDVHFVVCSADWAQEMQTLRTVGVPDARIIKLPVPEGDEWSYWEFAKHVVDDLRSGEHAHLPPETFLDYVVRVKHRAKILEADGIGVVLDAYWKYSDERLEEDRDAIETVTGGLTDAESKALYRTVLFGEPQDVWANYVRNCFWSLQYFDYLRFSKCSVVLNGGIWTGWEIPILLAAVPEDCAVYNVDPLGHDYLSEYAANTVSHFSDRVFERRLAIAGHDGEIELAMHRNRQAVPPGTGDSSMDPHAFACATIDTIAEDVGFSNFDVIKLDLEGGEEAAIRGMHNTIRQYRPQLAISIYHSMNHMWELPGALMDLCDDYRFFIRHYGWERWETILYCVPREVV